MMGRQDEPAQLLYKFSLDRHVPADHLLRQIDAVLDLSTIRRTLAPYYAAGGRPSIDPELMIRMLLVGYAFAIRSERRLCEEVHLHLAYRWFCRLGLEGDVPDHSTFSKNQHGRFRESDLFRQLFEQVVRMCLQAGLIGGEGFAIDASVIEADASLRRKAEGKLTAWPYDEEVSRPVRECLNALDQAVAAEAAPTSDDDMPPGNPPSVPQVTSLTDPAAAWTCKGRTKLCFAYGTNYLIDNKLAIIVDVEATPASWIGSKQTRTNASAATSSRYTNIVPKVATEAGARIDNGPAGQPKKPEADPLCGRTGCVLPGASLNLDHSITAALKSVRRVSRSGSNCRPLNS